MRPLVSIGDYAVPEPSTYSGTISTIVDSARNTQGVVIGSVIRENIAKVELTWKFISAEDWSVLMKKFIGVYGGSYYNNVTFFCSTTNDWETRQMYVSGDRTDNGIFLRRPDGSIRGYTGSRIALIEV